jgi:penicillin-binding protein 1B
MAALSPEPLALAAPETIERVWIDPQNNLRADSQCAGAVELPFIQGSAPQERSPCASAAGTVVDAVDTGVKRAKSWFERIFGR